MSSLHSLSWCLSTACYICSLYVTVCNRMQLIAQIGPVGILLYGYFLTIPKVGYSKDPLLGFRGRVRV